MRFARSFGLRGLRFVLLAYLLSASICLAQARSKPQAVNVRVVTDEADAVLAILGKQRAQQPIMAADWQRLFASEGYVRLKQREAAMGRSFADAEFKSFVLSAQLAGRTQALADTLHEWQQTDINGAARRALAYLPKQAHIQAKIYPVIKPRENSFVFDVDTDPAIFLYLDPAETKEQFANKLAHELHHIGYAGSCPTKHDAAKIARLPQPVRRLIKWVSAFGEGFAMLAAGGGPDVHPHKFSKPEDRARWEHELANFNVDLKQVEKFYLAILADKLTDEEREKAGYAFFGMQGPWYTVGWRMAVLIEKTYGRATLIACICDQRKLLATYNRAATKYNRTARAPRALWSSALIAALGKGRARKATTFAKMRFMIAPPPAS